MMTDNSCRTQDALPKVSIGVITYNHAAFVTECLDSIRLQTYPNLEVIVSDDGSRDDTVAVVQAYAAKYPDFSFRLVAQPRNLGITANCNFVLNATDGDFFICFAGDDIMMPDKVAEQVALLTSQPQASFCYSDCEWFLSSTGKKICNHFGWLQKPPRNLADVVADFTIPTPTMMVRRAMMPPENYDTRLAYFSDFMLAVRLMQRGPAGYIPRPLVRYRKHPESVMAQNMCVADRAVLITLFTALFTGDTVMEKAVATYRKVYFYALICDFFKQGKMMDGIKTLPAIFPQCVMSVKWIARDVRLVHMFILAILHRKKA